MRALTISQPWAKLIAEGEKFVENRVWSTNYRGPLVIHAGKGSQYMTRQDLARYDTGCIVAVADLVACVSLDYLQKLERGDIVRTIGPYTSREIYAHQYTEGPCCWVLANVRKLIAPIKVSGSQGLWTPATEIIEQLNTPAA